MKGKFIYLQIIFLFCAYHTYAQYSSWQWASALSSSNNEKGWDVAYDKTSNTAYLAGSFEGGLSSILGSTFASTAGGKDGIIAKYDLQGNPIWAIKIGGSSDDEVKSIAVDPFGDVYVTGYFSATADFDPSSSSYTLSPSGTMDGFLAKYSPAGTLVWATRFGGSGADDVWKLYVDSSAIYLTGSYNGTATFYSTNSSTKTTNAVQGKNNFFGAKYDLNGVINWVLSAGSSEDDEGLDVVADKNKVFFTGSYERNLTIYNSSGSGTTSLPIKNQDKSDVFVICCNQSGNVVWATNAASQDIDEGHGIAQDANNVYVTGSFRNNSIDFPYPSPVITKNNSGGTDIFIACIAKNNGSYQWVSAQTGSGNSDEEGYEIDVAQNGNIIVAGYFKNTLAFSSFGGTNLTSNGNEDIFVSGYDNSGNFLWAQKGGSNSSDFPHGISVSPAGEIFLAGEYGSAATFGQSVLPNGSGVNMFIAKLGCTYITNNSISQSQTVCAGNTAVLMGSQPSGGAAGTYTYTWESSSDQISWSLLQVTSSPACTLAPLYTSKYYRRKVSAAQTCNAASVSNAVYIAVDSLSPPAIAGNDFSVCSPTFVLNAQYPPYGTGSWSLVSGVATVLSPTNNTSVVTGLTTSAILRWTVKNGVCPATYDDINVTRDLPPAAAIAGADQQAMTEQITLSANTPSIGTGYWTVLAGNALIENPNNPVTTVKYLSEGDNIFRWTIKNGTCKENSDDVTVYLQPLEIPNAFSPNSDGFNDEFVVQGLERYTDVKLSVYNRWGNLVYYSPDYRNTWRGTNFNNERLSDDTYYYTLEIPGKKNYTGFLIIKQK